MLYALTLGLNAGLLGMATGRLPQPSFLTRFARGAVFNRKVFALGANIGFVLGALGGACVGYSLATKPVPHKSWKSLNEWKSKPYSKRVGEIAQSFKNFAIYESISVVSATLTTAGLARYKFFYAFHAFCSFGAGLYRAATFPTVAGMLVGGLAATNRKVVQ